MKNIFIFSYIDKSYYITSYVSYIQYNSDAQMLCNSDIAILLKKIYKYFFRGLKSHFFSSEKLLIQVRSQMI